MSRLKNARRRFETVPKPACVAALCKGTLLHDDIHRVDPLNEIAWRNAGLKSPTSVLRRLMTTPSTYRDNFGKEQRAGTG